MDRSAEIRYVADLAQVREVSLLGTADLAYWRDWLREEELVPAERERKAQILVTTGKMKFKGVRFTEVSFSVLVEGRASHAWRDQALLLRAYNSFRFFAFCERVLFATPYDHADCSIATDLPVSIRVSKGGQWVFRAELRLDAAHSKREPSATEEHGWNGPVFLPNAPRADPGQGRFFFARIRGHTRFYPFLSPGDLMTISPARDTPVLQALVDSHFCPEQWIVRPEAAHAKSKTYRRSDPILIAAAAPASM